MFRNIVENKPSFVTSSRAACAVSQLGRAKDLADYLINVSYVQTVVIVSLLFMINSPCTLPQGLVTF